MRQTPSIDPPSDETLCVDFPPAARVVSPQFVDPPFEFRLIPALRHAAQLRQPDGSGDPLRILALAGEAFHRAEHPHYRADHPLEPPEHEESIAFANAVADLSVTGRKAYEAFRAAPPDEATLASAIAVRLGPSVPDDELAVLANRALDRAFAVAWAIRGPVAVRNATREPLKWIAVSGEDDKPHRPVNVLPLDAMTKQQLYEQYEIPVTAHPGLTLQTRFFIASAVEDPAPAISPAARALPPDLVPKIPDGHKVILFLHGHSSAAEEALTIIPHIHTAGLDAGTRYSVVSIDLPNNGYSQTFDHQLVALAGETTYPAGIFDQQTPIHVPILDFVEDFVVAFVNALHEVTPIRDRFAGIIGGSLGGNLGLRLGRRPHPKDEWLDAGIVSWSPASVWPAMVENELLRQGIEGGMKGAKAPEVEASRHDDDSRCRYFAAVFEQPVAWGVMPHEQPYLWYRDDWQPCKDNHIKASRIARQEIYHADYRQWHWRLAGEQLIYSHNDRVDHHDPTSRPRYESNTVRQLLVAGRRDDAPGAHVYRHSQELADLMVSTPGRSLFLNDTGHSIHFERPKFLANEIVKFFTAPPSSMQITCIRRERYHSGAITLLGGIAHPTEFPFQMTEAECVGAIQAGDDFFVVGADGSRASVVVRDGPSSTFVITTRDHSRADNLTSLPEC